MKLLVKKVIAYAVKEIVETGVFDQMIKSRIQYLKERSAELREALYSTTSRYVKAPTMQVLLSNLEYHVANKINATAEIDRLVTKIAEAFPLLSVIEIIAGLESLANAYIPDPVKEKVLCAIDAYESGYLKMSEEADTLIEKEVSDYISVITRPDAIGFSDDAGDFDTEA